MRVCIIGAGVVGVTSAYLLARAGHEIVLLDECGEPAAQSSHANGGQLSYSYVAPLAGPGVLADVPGWLLRRDSPLRLRYRWDPRLWRWMAGFLAACRASVARASTAQMLTLSYLSRDTLQAILADQPLDFGLAHSGKLIVYRDPAKLRKAAALAAYQAGHGSEQRILSRDEAIAVEPALAGMGERIAGAVHTASEDTGDCRRFTQELFRRVQAMAGVDARLDTRVEALVRESGRIVAARTAGGEVRADAFVVAAGLGSRALLERLGERLPLYGLKGYSLSVPIEDNHFVPRISVTDYERRIVYARLDGVLRIAAMVDIGSEDTHLDTQRLDTLRRQVAEAFPRLDLSRAQAWAGLRPATPTGKPLIGRSRAAANLWLNAGHGALGFTLACGSAALLVALMEGRQPPIDPRPFAPE